MSTTDPPVDWEAVERSPEFQQLIAARRRFVLHEEVLVARVAAAAIGAIAGWGQRRRESRSHLAGTQAVRQWTAH